VTLAGVAGGHSSGQATSGQATSGTSLSDPPAVTAFLDQYLAGASDEVVAELSRRDDFDDLLEELRADGRGWTLAAGPGDARRRELAAATFALEAARAAQRVMDWKWVQRVRLASIREAPNRLDTGLSPQYVAPDSLWWKPPPLLIEWGCELLRQQPEPTAAERLWHLAAMAVAQRVSDYEFLIGSPWDERGNPEDEFEHLKHSIARFPEEPRFGLGQAIAVEWRTWPTSAHRSRSSARNLPDAVSAFREAMKNDVIAPEAMVRLGVVELRRRRPDDAIRLFERVVAATRDPYLVYLAHYFRGQAHERENEPERARDAYRAALATIPRAQSATMALAAMLARADRPLEAAELVEASLQAPIAMDPWREYAAADDRFWPYLIGRLRAEVQDAADPGGGR
jgi:tetratricopeptide (TPR) repeat protein